MRRLKLYIAVSLDGYIAGQQDELDWLPRPSERDDFGYGDFIAGVDTLLMGHRTYEVVNRLGQWPYPAKTCHVLTRHPGLLAPAPGVRFTSQTPVELVEELRRQPGRDLWLVGGGQLVEACQEAGLIDDYLIALVPQLLGSGIPLWPTAPDRPPSRLAFQRCTPHADGVVMLHYCRPD